MSSAARVRLAGRAGRAVSAASRRLGFGGGSVIGGRVALLLAPDLLARLSVGRSVALVSGTNGKTTTTRLLAAALGGPEVVATSTAGANLPPGLALALADSAPGATAVLEVDEAYVGAVVQATGPRAVVLLNLSRDQLDRVSEVRMVANRWRAALAGGDRAGGDGTGGDGTGGDGTRPETTVVANADDPLVVWAAATAPKVIWVAAGLVWRSDATGCPSCDGHIDFGPVDFGTDDNDGAGGWSCPCGFRRPSPDARLVGDELVTADGRRLPLHLGLPSRANRANAAMAAVAAGVLGVDEADALAAMSAVRSVEGRFSIVAHGDTTARLLLAKNPAGWAELLDLLEGGKDPVVIGINARIADGHDPSWLWDVDFERLAGRLVVATGDRRRDLAVRLRYAGVAHLVVDDQLAALGAAGAPSIEYVGNYTAFQDLRRLVAGDHRAVTAPSDPSVGDGTPGPARTVPALSVPTASSSAAASSAASSSADGGGGRDHWSALRVVVIYPDLLGTYGDSGNGRILAARAGWRGIDVELVLARSDAPLPRGADLYCIGGGEDGPQIQAAERLADGALAAAVDGGAAVLAVCAGYQILGSSFPGPDGRRYEGLGLLDVDTVKGTGRRCVGEVVAEPLGPDLPGPPLPPLTGFENHGGLTTVGPSAAPWSRVVSGVGNGDGSGTDGARAGRIIATYLHGPVLARNPGLADLLLSLATGTVLDPLDDEEEGALHDERLAARSSRAGSAGRTWRIRAGRRWSRR